MRNPIWIIIDFLRGGEDESEELPWDEDEDELDEQSIIDAFRRHRRSDWLAQALARFYERRAEDFQTSIGEVLGVEPGDAPPFPTPVRRERIDGGKTFRGRDTSPEPAEGWDAGGGDVGEEGSGDVGAEGAGEGDPGSTGGTGSGFGDFNFGTTWGSFGGGDPNF